MGQHLIKPIPVLEEKMCGLTRSLGVSGSCGSGPITMVTRGEGDGLGQKQKQLSLKHLCTSDFNSGNTHLLHLI